MPRYTKLPKTRKKKPDEFISTIDHLVRWGSDNSKKILFLVLVIVLMSIGYLVIKQKQRKDLMAFNEELFQALSDKVPDADKEGVLQGIVKKYGRYDVSVAARIPLSQLYLDKKEFSQALNQMNQASRVSWVALASLVEISEVEVLRGEGKFDEALEVIEKYASGDHPYLKYIKAQILEEKGMKHKALALYQELSENSENNSFFKKRAQEKIIWLLAQGEK